MALRRINSELQKLESDPPDGISASPISDNNLFEWRGRIMGPDGTPYENGIYVLLITFPNDYPFKPPKIRFETKIYHSSVNDRGGIDCNILFYDWSPALNISKVLISIRSCMSSGGTRDVSLNFAAEKLMKSDMYQFVQKIMKWNHEHAGGASPKQRSLHNLNHRGPTEMECKQRPNIIDYCITTYYGVNESKIISLIINEYCGNIPYYPFPFYLPWIEFCVHPSRYSNYQQNLQKLKMKIDEYHLTRFNQNDDDKNKMNILIRRLTGQVWTIKCVPSDYILTLKIMIEKRYRIPVNKMKLIFAGKQLQDHYTLSICNIQKESTLHLFVSRFC